MNRHLTVAVFVVHQNKTLLHLHKKLGSWLPVGGHVDPNESPCEAAIRETQEEAGLTVELYRHLPVVDAKGTLVGFLSQRDFLAMSVSELLKQTARISFITLAKAPPVWILLAGMLLYTILILYVK